MLANEWLKSESVQFGEGGGSLDVGSGCVSSSAC